MARSVNVGRQMSETVFQREEQTSFGKTELSVTRFSKLCKNTFVVQSHSVRVGQCPRQARLTWFTQWIGSRFVLERVVLEYDSPVAIVCGGSLLVIAKVDRELPARAPP